MAVNNLNAGQAAFVSYETDATAGGSPDALRFVLLADILSGTTLYITDRSWSGTAFVSGGGDGTFTYSAPSDLLAGTIITLSASELATSGITLSNAGETVYLYQGASADAPSRFIFAMDIADGNNTFNGTLSGTGLTAGTNAVAVAADNAVYNGSPTGLALLQARSIATASHWFGSDQDDNPGTSYSDVLDTTTNNVLNPPDMVMLAVMAGGGQSDAILRIGKDDGSTVADNLTRLFRDNTAFNHLTDVSFDVDAGYFFVVDSDGNNINRILRGDIADLVSGNPSPTFLQIFATDGLNDGAGPAAPGEIIPGIEIDKAAGKIYWMDGDLFGNFEGGFELWEADYDGGNQRLIQTIDTENPDAFFGFPGGVGDFAVANGFAYVVASTASVDGLGDAVVTQNHILKIDLSDGAVEYLELGDGTGEGYMYGRLDPAQGQIIGIDVDSVTGNVWFVTQGISASDHGGIFRFVQGGSDGTIVSGTLTEMWEMPAEEDYSATQSFPTTNLTHIEVDEIGGRYYVSAGNDSNFAESDASIFSGSLTATPGTDPTLFVRAFEPTSNGAPLGMEINYAPVTAAVSNDATYTEQLAAQSIFASVTLTDADNTMIRGATVAITEGFVAGDRLNVTPAGSLTALYDTSTGLLTISGIGTLAEYQTMLASVTFSHIGSNPTNYGNNQSREIAVTAFDGLAYSDPISATVDVVGINNAPVTTPGNAATGNEDSTITVTGISISDVDADPANQDMQVTLSVPIGTLTLGSTTDLTFTTGDGSADATMTFSGRANAINAALATLEYSPPADVNGAVTLTITTSDLGHTGNGGPLTASATKSITINGINDAPVVSGDGTETAAAILEDQPSATGQLVSQLFGGQFSDAADNQTANGGTSANTFAGIAVVSISTVSGAGEWQWFDGATWTAIASPSSSTAPVFSASTALRFNPAADYNGPTPTLTAHLIDSSGSLPSNGTTVNISSLNATGGTTPYSTGTVTISSSVTAVNDAPTIGNLASDGATYTEGQIGDALLDVSANALVGDIDSTNFDGGSLTVEITGGREPGEDVLTIDTSGTVTVSGGNVLVSGTVIGTFSGGTGDDPLDFEFNASATPAAVQALIRAIGYTNLAGDTPIAGTRDITWSLFDGDGDGFGGADEVIVTSTVNVLAVNDEPSGADKTITGAENTTTTLTAADFGFSDVDGNAFLGVIIQSTPANGELRLNGVPVTPPYPVEVADIDAGRLTFVPDSGESGNGYAMFTFSVVDDGGTADGGQDTDQTPNTITFDITPANLPPVVEADTNTIQEDATPNTVMGNVLTNDSDPNGDTLTVANAGTITLQYGSLQINADGSYTYTLDNSNPAVDALNNGQHLDDTFTYTASDGHGGTTSSTLTIRINGRTDNFPPESADNTVTIDEDASYTFAAADFAFTDVDLGDELTAVRIDTITLPTGASLQLSGVDVAASDVIAVADIHNLVFTPAPDANGTGYASFTFSVSDGTAYDLTSNTFTFDVTAQPDAPVITSNGGGATAAVSIVENTKAVTTVTADDPDASTTFTYSITGGADQGKFTIDAATGALAFAAAPNFEVPTDVGADNVYDVVVTASDGALTDSQAIAVTVTNVNEAPVITSNGGGATAAVSVVENSTTVTTVVASDQDAGTTLTYSITGGADQSKFTIDAATGALAFIAAPDFEVPTDVGANNVYDVQVTASDGTLTDVQDIAVTVTNQNETPTITSNGGGATASISVAENATAVTTVVASDPDAGTTLTYSITGGADQSKFTIDAATGALAFIAAPDFETPTDVGADNVYDVVVTASDGALTDSQAIAVTITNVNEAPVITSNGGGTTTAVSVTENSTTVTTVVASDQDAGTTLTYSITGGADQSKFTIDAATGALAFITAPDFEDPTDLGANNVYDVQVTASDGSLADVQDIAVTVTNQNETPTITSNGGGATAAISVSENATTVTTVAASDPDAGTTLTYSITGGADQSKFTIDAATGALAFIAAPDFETPTDVGADNVYDVVVTASDGALTDSQAIAVTVTNVNETPVITSNGGGATAAVSVTENNTTVTTVVASDPDAGTTLTYSITGGADQSKFTIDAATGALAFIAAPDFEVPTDIGANNVYDVQVTASDGSLTDMQDIAVTVTNQNEAPTITSNGGGATAAISIAENITTVTTVSATDPDAGTTLVYSITGGADQSKFTIDATTGALAFAAAPNFEVPSDVGADNVYDVVVTASDGALTDSQAIAVTVTNVNEAPVITSNGGGATAAVNVIENATAVTTVVAIDQDAGTTLTYSISGGADQGKFTINATTGALAFITAPNFEAPTDIGGNNVYDVQVTVSDGTLTDVQAIAVTVVNRNEAPQLNIPIVDQVSPEDSAINFTLPANTFSDPDGPAPTLSATLEGGAPLPSWLTFNPATGQFTGQPPADFNGDFSIRVTATDGSISVSDTFTLTITPVNDAPVAGNDNIISQQDTPVVISIAALLANDFDPDGDTITFTGITSDTRGTATVSGAFVVFTPDNGFTGQGSFTYAISDGNGLSGTGIVTVSVGAAANQPPFVNPDVETFGTLVGRAISFTVPASDPDGDPLTFTGSLPANGTLLLSTGGTYIYTPTAGFIGTETITVTVRDNNGGTDVYTATINVLAPDTPNDWRLLTSDGWTGEIGGSGSVFGTSGFDDVTVLDVAGHVAFDPSFNDGGDVIRLAGTAAEWHVARDGSNAILFDGDTLVTIPVGIVGADIVFDDGARELVFNTQTSTMSLGGQSFEATLVPVTAPSDVNTIGTGDVTAVASLLLQQGVEVQAGGRIDVFGTAEADETVILTGGKVTFDPSFNGGGDTLELDADADTFSARLFGSSIILEGSGYELTIPVGLGGMDIAFADDTRILIYNPGNDTVFLGTQAIGATTVPVSEFA